MDGVLDWHTWDQPLIIEQTQMGQRTVGRDNDYFLYVVIAEGSNWAEVYRHFIIKVMSYTTIALHGFSG